MIRGQELIGCTVFAGRSIQLLRKLVRMRQRFPAGERGGSETAGWV